MLKVGKYQLDAMCYDEDGVIKMYYWDLGDGATSTARRVYLEVKEATGSKTIRVTATDDSGGVGTAEETVSAN